MSQKKTNSKELYEAMSELSRIEGGLGYIFRVHGGEGIIKESLLEYVDRIEAVNKELVKLYTKILREEYEL